MVKKWRDFRGVSYFVGAVVAGLGVAMGLCSAAGALFNWLDQDESLGGGAVALAQAGAVTFALGLAVLTYGKRYRTPSMTRREALLTVALIWTVAGFVGALPFVFGGGLGPMDALFETFSGLTTTGATVVTDIEGTLPRPVLLWRSLLQWLGGMGIVVLFVAVFPSVGKGGKMMFKGEVPGATGEGLKPRIAETSFALWKIYIGLTTVEAVALFFAGLSPFDAVCHALTTLSTGGFSTRNDSIGAWDSPLVHYIISGFMFLATVNFGLYYVSLKGRSVRPFLRSTEFKAFVAIALSATLLITLGLLKDSGGNIELAFRRALFAVGTSISSTGYGMEAHLRYPSAILQLLIVLMLIGGCSGSTAGGIKIERMLILARQAGAQVRKGVQPSIVRVVRLGRLVIDNSVTADVASLVVIYMLCLATGGVLVGLIDGVPAETAFGAMLTCLSNMGPAPFYVGDDNFAGYSAPAKAIFAAAMVLGRLEFLSVFALLLPTFWRR